METDFTDYKINLTITANLPIEGDPDEYINRIRAELLYFNSKKKDYRVCGRLEAYFVNVEQMTFDGESAVLTVDDYSHETSDLAELFELDEDEIEGSSQNLAKALNWDEDDVLARCKNFVYLSRLEVVAKHRGKGAGIYFLRETMDYLAKNMTLGFFIVKIFPLQIEYHFRDKKKKPDKWTTKMAFEKFETDCVAAAQKVCRLYGKLGFACVSESLFMACNWLDFMLEPHAPDAILEAEEIE